jgi:hypothetical protein
MAIGVASALAAGTAWRFILREALRALLRYAGYSWADETASAWDCLQENSRYGVNQLTVELDDGRYLYCSDTRRVAKLPFGPFTLGARGDLLMYVDRSQSPSGEVRDVEGVFDEDWGDLVTYIPKERIRKIAIRVS